MTWYRPILSVIILLINKSDSQPRSQGLWSRHPKGNEGLLLEWGDERRKTLATGGYSYGWLQTKMARTLLSPITIIRALMSLSLFWLAESVLWIFLNHRLWRHLARNFTIMMTKDTQSHRYSCHVWPQCMRVIVSSSHASCCLPSLEGLNRVNM